MSRFTLTSPRGETCTPSSGCRKSRLGAWPIARMMVSQSNWVSLFVVERRIETVVLIEDIFRLQALQANHLAVASQHPLRSEAGMHDDAFGLRLFDLFQRRRHLIAILQANEADLACAHAQG